MKKIIVLLFMFSAIATCKAQFSVGGGGMVSNHYLEGCYVGGYVGIDVNGFLYQDESLAIGIAPGVFYSYEIKDQFYSTQYIGVPCKLNIGLKVSDQHWIRIFAGPTLDFGTSSVSEYSYYSKWVNVSYLESDYDQGTLNRFDFMFGGGLALDVSKIRFTVGADYGLLDRTGKGFHRAMAHAGLAFLF